MRVYIGWDPRDDLAFRACVSSMRKHSSIPLDIYPLREHELRHRGLYLRSYLTQPNGQMIDEREWRPFSTQFSFTRFLLPSIDKGNEPILFSDPDILWRGDVAQLLAAYEPGKAIMCVQHDHRPPETIKMDGVMQMHYRRKNWSSVMLMQPSLCTITAHTVNTASRLHLHAFAFQKDETIGALPEKWNWLEGWSDPSIEPAAVHYTRGTPDMVSSYMPYAHEWWAAVANWKPDMNHYGLEDKHPYWPPGASLKVV